ncbi:10971_t:CDS:1, partial [Acaulospora colombiana]
MEKEVIIDFFIKRRSSILTAFTNYLPHAIEPCFAEMINCLSIILEKVGSEFWLLISNQDRAYNFVQHLFDTFFSIKKTTHISSVLCSSLSLVLKVLRTTYLEQESITAPPEEPIWLTILREDTSKIDDIYCGLNRIPDLDNLSKLDHQLRCVVWRNLFKYASESISTSSDNSKTILPFMECFNKIALMDNNLDFNQTSNRDPLVNTFVDSISRVREYMNRFLDELQKVDSKRLTTLLPVNGVSTSIIHLLSSPDSRLMTSGLMILKKSYINDSYNELIRENTKQVIQ